MRKFIKILLILLLFLILHSCKDKSRPTQDLIMHEPSEMALLMRQMYEYNKLVKQQIIAGDSLTDYPEDFKKIHTAVLTNPEEKDAEYDSLANVFLTFQNKAFNTKKDSVVYYFNKSVNACVTCHTTRCTGPIPKIKRLKIQ
ncbi:MAG: hypothetical protein CSA39_01545 [Flavobacteriales bacterium]|nr:MAG: hypothetical protein CSA39_01545 [Flavobacteriales bacterium]